MNRRRHVLRCKLMKTVLDTGFQGEMGQRGDVTSASWILALSKVGGFVLEIPTRDSHVDLASTATSKFHPTFETRTSPEATVNSQYL